MLAQDVEGVVAGTESHAQGEDLLAAACVVRIASCVGCFGDRGDVVLAVGLCGSRCAGGIVGGGCVIGAFEESCVGGVFEDAGWEGGDRGEGVVGVGVWEEVEEGLARSEEVEQGWAFGEDCDRGFERENRVRSFALEAAALG